MINWTEIDAEVEAFQEGYRSGFISIFKKYEGQETDERAANNKIVKVTVASFAARYGIADTTFRRWISEDENVTTAGTYSKPANFTERMAKAAAEAAAQAKAEAEAAAQEQLAKALAEQKRAEEAKAADHRRQERTKHEAELAEVQARMRQEKLEALARQEKQLKEEAGKRGLDLSQLTASDKSKLMVMLANDPEQARDWFNAYNQERTRKLSEQHQKQKEDAEKRRFQMEEREAREAARKASQEFDDSGLHFFINKVVPQIDKLRHEMSLKPITFTHMMYSGMTPHQLVEMTNRCEDIIVQVREGLFSANAENELADLNQDTP